MTELLSNLPAIDALDFVGNSQQNRPKGKKRSKTETPGIQETCKTALKKLFAFSQSSPTETRKAPSILDPECIDTFDAEQLWAIIQLENDSLLPRVDKSIKRLNESDYVSLLNDQDGDEEMDSNSQASEENESVLEPSSGDENSLEEETKEDSEEEDDQEEDEEEEEEKEGESNDDLQTSENTKTKQHVDGDTETTEIDDEFFKMADMDRVTEMFEEEQREQERLKKLYEKEHAQRVKDRKADRDDEYSDSDDGDDSSDAEYLVDEFDDKDEEKEGEKLMFSDFFGGRKGTKTEKRTKKVKFSGIDETEYSLTPERNEEEQQDLSTYEKQQKERQEKLRELEEKAIAEKPWEMKGEAMARSRPENSLLEKGDLDVQYISTPAPTITMDVTESLEDIIRKRIADGDYDDVVRKLPMEQRAEYRPKIELSTEKSKVGLGEAYAKEYEEKVLGNRSDADIKYTAEQEEIRKLFSGLVSKLNALSNFHFTPKPPKAEGGVQRLDVPSINMEEATPAALASGSQLAPEEIYATKHGKAGLGKSNEELEKEDRKRLRQQKKAAKRKRKRQRDAEKRIVSKLSKGVTLPN
mmetsp:Transcript_8799/g.11448  ORF Transcript_8799/g.11448 Transcript_8799/m.11448 type:complete len:583 (+) Transcript_8799:85-1833(+)